jgi:beta-glucanase (GH16 family)
MLGKNIIEPGGYWTSTFGSASWPACGEIDIMEHWGTNQNYVQSAMHTPSSSGNTVNLGGRTISTASTQFHLYSLEWSATSMIFSVDNVVHYVYNPAVKNASTWPFDAEQYLLLNVAIESNIATNFVQSAMEVDYVRVYQQGSALSVQDSIKLNEVVLFPNPVTDKLNVKVKENQIGNQVAIYSLLGQELNSYILNAEETILDVSKYQNGIYLLKIDTNSGIQTYRFIKK